MKGDILRVNTGLERENSYDLVQYKRNKGLYITKQGKKDI